VPPTSLTLPREADRVLISVNPKAGRRSAARRVDRLAELLGRRGLKVERFTDLTEVAARANRLHREGVLRGLVGVGGDGTASELVNRTEPGVPITLLAAGTANLLARYLGLSGKPEDVCETIAAGNLRRLDAGTASGRIFLLMVGCGFDAEVVRRVDARRQTSRQGGHIGYSSYVKPIFESIRSYEYPAIRVYCDEQCDGSAESPTSGLVVRWAFVLNLPRYGWGLPLAPAAVGTDGLLDLCTFERGSLWSGLRYAAAAQFGGRHRRMTDCVIRRARRIRITAAVPVAYQLDGDPGGHLPVEIEVLDRRLTAVVPLPRA